MRQSILYNTRNYLPPPHFRTIYGLLLLSQTKHNHVMHRLMRRKYGGREESGGCWRTDRTAEIKWTRRRMGWSSATREGKTAVAPLNPTGGYIVWEWRDQRRSRQGREKIWEYNPRHGSLPLGCKVRPPVNLRDGIVPEKSYPSMQARDIPIRADIGQFRCRFLTN